MKHSSYDESNTKRTRVFVLIGMSLLFVAFNGSVMAQEDSGSVTGQAEAATSSRSADDSAGIDEIVVKGIRGGLQEARDIKRDASSFVDAIASTELGRFPDENVAESLQRITGVQINRVRGEGNSVNIRGLPTIFTRVQLNGNSVASASGSLERSAISVERSFDFQMLPSEFVRALEVIKSPTAKMAEGGLSGTVNVRTARPLQLDARTFVLSAFGANESNADANSPRASGMYSDKFADDRLGILVAAAFTKRQPETHRLRMDDSFVVQNELTTRGAPTDLNGDGVIEDINFNIPGNIRTELFREVRERTNFASVVEYEVSDNWSILAEGFYSELDVVSEDNQYVLLAANSNAGENWDPAGTVVTTIDGVSPDSALFGNEFITTISLGGVDHRANGRIEDRTADTEAIALSAEYENGLWLANFGINFSSSHQISSNLTLATIPRFQVRYILEPGAGAIGLEYSDESTARLFDPDQAIAASFNGAFGQVVDDEIQDAHIDIERAFDEGLISSLNFGAKYTVREQFGSGERLAVAGGVFGPLAGLDLSTTQPATGGYNVAPFMQRVSPSSGGFLDAYGGSVSFPRAWLGSNTFKVLDAIGIDALVAAGNINENRASWVDVEEDTFAAYVMADFADDSGRISGNFGIRIVHTSQLSTGVAPNFDGLQFLDDQGGTIVVPAGENVVVDRSYTEILPSANLKIELSDDLMLRFAASRTMTRPALRQLSPSTTVAAFSRIITRNNPELDPFISTNFDFGLEWYFSDDSQLTLALFNKDLSSLVESESRTVPLLLEVVSAVTPINEIRFFDFTENSLVNGVGVTLKGFELGYQQLFTSLPKPFDGLGVQANYTYIDNSNPNVITGASENNYNLSSWYETDKFAARLSYTWRDRFVSQGLPFGLGGLGAVTEARGVLDANITYNVTDYASIVFEGINLTETIIRDTTLLGNYPRLLEDSGRRLMLGFRVAF